MSLLIIDRRPAYLGEDQDSTSLLMLPLGSRSYIDYIISSVGETGDVWIVPAFAHSEGYEKSLASLTHSSLKVVSRDRLTDAMGGADPEDMVIVIDAGVCPGCGFSKASTMIGDRGYLGATHVVAVGDGTERARERIVRDAQGNVRQVKRLFQGTSWPHVAHKRLAMSIVPAGALTNITFASLQELRQQLGESGVLQQDQPLVSGIVNLNTQEDALKLAEQLMPSAFRRAHHRRYSRKGRHVLVGSDCWIDKSVRIVGPVVIHDDVMIEEDACIIGPTIIGPGSRIGRGSVVAQSVLARDAVVESENTVRHLVSAGGQSNASLANQSSNGNGFAPLDFDPYASITGLENSKVESLPGYQKKVQMGIKRVIDVIASICVLIVFSPLLAIVALIIKLDSKGPLFFVHHREGKGGKEFPCIKFRTMGKDAHSQQKELYAQSEVDGPQFKMDHDPRVTRFGAFLRATNIDELPQFVNVLLGHMSIIGPRPSPFRENQVCVPWRRARLSVNPGITGLWQVCRSVDRSEGDFHEWIFYDTIYVKQFSLWLDVKIFMATVLTLGGRWNVPLSWIVSAHGHGKPRVQSPSTAQVG
ncbi:MAG: sugar transferase [Phycisphaerae bacterium]|nr:sugar transferase [Phycisphaerales bacterium]